MGVLRASRTFSRGIIEADRSWSEWRTYGGSYIHDGVRATGDDQRLGIEVGSSIVERGKAYNVQVRARYRSGGHNDAPWSGPWAEAGPTTVN